MLYTVCIKFIRFFFYLLPAQSSAKDELFGFKKGIIKLFLSKIFS